MRSGDMYVTVPVNVWHCTDMPAGSTAGRTQLLFPCSNKAKMIGVPRSISHGLQFLQE